jgi:hypothetical protein
MEDLICQLEHMAQASQLETLSDLLQVARRETRRELARSRAT